MEVQNTPALPNMPVPAMSKAVDAATLRRNAVEFESILIAQVLEKLEKTYSCMPGEEPTDAAHETEGNLATQALATGLARAGGFGFAKMILNYLAPPDESQAGSTPAR